MNMFQEVSGQRTGAGRSTIQSQVCLFEHMIAGSIGQVRAASGHRAARHGWTARRPLEIRPQTEFYAYAVRSTGDGGCDGRISANATWMMPPANPSATPMRQAMV